MNFKQSPIAIMMMRPASFGFNVETAASNTFQSNDIGNTGAIQTQAQIEFDRMVELLLAHDVDVKVFNETPLPHKPDAIFPNNWISFHQDGKVIIYPMMATNRRLERRLDIVEELKELFRVNEVIFLEENGEEFLEGTGSLVFDHPNKIVYACKSVRTNANAVAHVAKVLGYEPIIFDAVDEQGLPIYHTNVILSVGEQFVVICLDAIRSDDDQERLLNKFASTHRKVIAISFAQMRSYACNILEVMTKNSEHLIIMSETAFKSLIPGQVNALSEFAEILSLPIEIIEKYGGGSVRCMMAGIHLPVK